MDLLKLQGISCTTKPTDLLDFQKDPFYQKTTIWDAYYLHLISLNYDNLETVACTCYSTVQITKLITPLLIYSVSVHTQ